MEGHIAKLPNSSGEKNAFIVLDDAHGFGVLGNQGRGVANHFNLNDEVMLSVPVFLNP